MFNVYRLFRMNKPLKNPHKYICLDCDYNTSNKKDYNKHITTAKHTNRTNRTQKSPKIPTAFVCECGKKYTVRNSLWYHKQKCQHIPSIDNIEGECTDMDLDIDLKSTHQQVDSSVVLELLKQNQEFKELMIDQHRKMSAQQDTIIELSKNQTVYNMTNNTTNNKFNLNVYLNETCKDAINLNDFIQSIQLNPGDFETTGELGYVGGISRIMLERIRVMEPHTRPLHCTDLKRETVYVKDSNRWQKEDDNKTHLRKAVRIVADKNKQQLYPWQDENPDYEILDTPECEKFFEYAKVSLGGYGKDEGTKFENKIIHNVLKEVVVDKHVSNSVVG